MNPPCSKCDKTVYPMEKISALGKYWHKDCFRCVVCDVGLTLKTFKGYSKEPYCNNHYPTTKITAVKDTPENKRLKQTQKPSNMIKYHKKFEKEKGSYTLPDDDISTRMELAKLQDVKYSGLSAQALLQSKRGLDDQPPMPSADQPPRPSNVQRPFPPGPRPPPSGSRYRALYDYAGADDDEVSFNKGDRIINVNVIDDGWMEGKVERTGQFGMLPSNYVEKV